MDFGSPPLLALRLAKDISLIVASRIPDASKNTMTSDPAQTTAAAAVAVEAMTMMTGFGPAPKGVSQDFLARWGLTISPPHPGPVRYARTWGPLRVDDVADEALVRHFDASPPSPSSAVSETLREQLLAILADDEWTSICGYRLGNFSDRSGCPGDADTEATILVTDAVLAIRSALAARNDGALAKVAIEITNGKIQPALSPVGQLNCVKDVTDKYANSPLPGASVGASHLGIGSGTLGGYFRAVIDGKAIYLALVCHHVISRHEEPITAPASGPVVCSPSDEDHAHGLRKLKFLLAPGLATPDHRPQVEDLILRLEAHDRILGKVVCSSGLGRRRDGYLMDWALVQLSSARMPTSMNQHSQGLHDSMFSSAVDQLVIRDASYSDDFFRPAEDAMHLTKEALDIEVDLKRHTPVIKSGRSTKNTTGYWHRIEPSITVHSPIPGRFLARGRALSIFSGAGYDAMLFAQLGDSGALVYDFRQRYLGNIVAIDDKKCVGPLSLFAPPTVYISPMVIILRDIEESLAQAFGTTKVKIEPVA